MTFWWSWFPVSVDRQRVLLVPNGAGDDDQLAEAVLQPQARTCRCPCRRCASISCFPNAGLVPLGARGLVLSPPAHGSTAAMLRNSFSVNARKVSELTFPRAPRQRRFGRRNIVRGLDKGHEVVLAHHQVKRLELGTEGPTGFAHGVYSTGGVLDGGDAWLSMPKQREVGRHESVSRKWFTLKLTGERSPRRARRRLTLPASSP